MGLVTFTESLDNAIHVEVDFDGTIKWFLNGKQHREDGPAIEFTDGTKFWFVNDYCHRVDGPAIEWNTGICCWYINGVRYKNIESYCKAANITGVSKTLFLLKWGNNSDQSINNS
jgi:hypothetical protein